MADVRYLAVVDGVRVVQAVDFESADPAFTGTMTMTWEVAEDHDGTRVTLRADDVPSGIDEQDHLDGFRSSLGQLEHYLGAQAQDSSTPPPAVAEWPPAVVIGLARIDLVHDSVPADQVVTGRPTMGSVTGATIGGAEIGIWEISPGVVTDTEADEVFVVLSGRATVSFVEPALPDIEIGPGDLVRLAAGQQTVWTVHERLRKVFVVAPTQ